MPQKKPNEPPVPDGPVFEAFIEALGSLYAEAGRPVLEGRFVSILLSCDEEIGLGEAASRLGVHKAALSRLANAMLERGSVKRSVDPRSRVHSYSLADHAYSFDVRVQVDASHAIATATRDFLEHRDLPAGAIKKLRHHATFCNDVASSLERVLRPEEDRQAQDIEQHLEENWDALPPSDGPPNPLR